MKSKALFSGVIAIILIVNKTFGTKARGALALGLIPVAAVGLTGCVATNELPDEVAPSGNSQEETPRPSETEETPVATESPVVNESDIVGNAQSNSGLTPEQYQQDHERVVIGVNGPDFELRKLLTQLRNEHGKPVVVIAYTTCPPGIPGAGNTRWGIGGALSERVTTECGTGPAASKDAAVAEVIARAEKRGWDTSDYILYVVA